MIPGVQDLRDKLLKAGLVQKEQARQSKADKRRARRQQGRRPADDPELRAQEQRHQERLAEQAAQARARQAALNEARAQQAHLARVRDLIRRHAQLKVGPGERAFYFVGPDRAVRKIWVSHEVADQLSAGQLAIVQTDDDPRRDYALVAQPGVGRLSELAPERILFRAAAAAPGGAEDPGGGA